MAKSTLGKQRDATRKAAKRAWRGRRLHLAWASGDRCQSCAYRAGTVASGDSDDAGLTRLRRALLDAAQPFYCHETGPTNAKKLCNGHMEALTKRTRSGFYEAHPPDAPAVLGELEAAYWEREGKFAAAIEGAAE